MIDLSPIGNLSGLKGLDFRDNKLKEIDLSSLQYLNEMEIIDLRDNPITEYVDVLITGKVRIMSGSSG
jgi:Leucine-rich repeat (LRR) protein